MTPRINADATMLLIRLALNGMTPADGVTYLCELGDQITELLEGPKSTLPETDADFELPELIDPTTTLEGDA